MDPTITKLSFQDIINGKILHSNCNYPTTLVIIGSSQRNIIVLVIKCSLISLLQLTWMALARSRLNNSALIGQTYGIISREKDVILSQIKKYLQDIFVFLSPDKILKLSTPQAFSEELS